MEEFARNSLDELSLQMNHSLDVHLNRFCAPTFFNTFLSFGLVEM